MTHLTKWKIENDFSIEDIKWQLIDNFRYVATICTIRRVFGGFELPSESFINVLKKLTSLTREQILEPNTAVSYEEVGK